YAGEALGAVTVAYFTFRALGGSETDAWLAAGYLGLAGGLRQSLLLLLFPLWLGAAAVGVRRLPAVALGLAVLGAAAPPCVLPMIWLTGGFARYVAASMDLADGVVKPTSILGGSFETTLRMSRHVLESVLVGLGPLALAAGLIPWYARRHGWGRAEWFLIGWTVPPILTYTLVHFGQAGYVLTFRPALVVLLSRVLMAALGEALLGWPRLRPLAATAVVTVVVLVNGSFFVSARPLPRDFDTPRSGWQKAAADEASEWIFS